MWLGIEWGGGKEYGQLTPRVRDGGEDKKEDLRGFNTGCIFYRNTSYLC